jgi:hypothetical protein
LPSGASGHLAGKSCFEKFLCSLAQLRYESPDRPET